jgi:hypothetical protein
MNHNVHHISNLKKENNLLMDIAMLYMKKIIYTVQNLQ